MYLKGNAKWNMSDKEKNNIQFHLYVESIKQNKWTNKTEKNFKDTGKQTNKLVVSRGEKCRRLDKTGEEN